MPDDTLDHPDLKLEDPPPADPTPADYIEYAQEPEPEKPPDISYEEPTGDIIFDGLNGTRIRKSKIKTSDLAWFILVWASLKIFLIVLHVYIYAENLDFDNTFLSYMVSTALAGCSVILPFLLFSYLIFHKFGKTVWSGLGLFGGFVIYAGIVFLEFNNFNFHLYEVLLDGDDLILKGEALKKSIADATLFANCISVALTASTFVFTAVIAQKHADLISTPLD